MTDRWTASKTPAPTAADEDNKNKLHALAEMASKVSPHVSLTHAVQPAQDKMAAMTYNGAILTQNRASIKAPANSSAQTSYLQPPRTLPGHMQQTPSEGTCNLEDEERAEAAPHLRLEKRSGKLPRRPIPRYTTKGAGALRLSSVPGFGCTTKTLSLLRGAAKAPTLSAVPMSAGFTAAADNAVAAAPMSSGAHPLPVARSASVARAAAIVAAQRGAATKRGAVATVDQTSKRGKSVAGATRATQLTSAAAAEANVANADAVAGMLSLTADKANLDEVLKAAPTKMRTHDDALHMLAHAVGDAIVQQSAVPSAVARPVAQTDAKSMPQTATQALLAPSYASQPQAERPKSSNWSEGVSVGASAKESVPPHPTPALRVPPLTTAQKATIRHASEVAKKRVQGMLLMCTIRDDLTPRVKAIVGGAETTMNVPPSPNIRHNLIIDLAMNTMKMDEAAAEQFLESIVNKPTKQRLQQAMGNAGVALAGSTSNTTRVNAALHQAIHAVIGNLKRNVVQGWFLLVTSRSRVHMLSTSAAYWLEDDKFWKLPLGRKGIVAELARGLKYLGCLWRLREPVNLGEELVGSMATGHLCLAVQFMYEVLTNIKDGTNDDGGIDPSRYRKYVETVIKMDKELPKSCTEDRGVILTDGDDPMRAVFGEEFMPVLPPQSVVATKLSPEGGERAGEEGGEVPAIPAAVVGGEPVGAAAAMRGGADGAAAATRGGGVGSVEAVGGVPAGATAAVRGEVVGAAAAVGVMPTNPAAALGRVPASTAVVGGEVPAGAAVTARWAAEATAPARGQVPASALTAAASGAVARAAAKRAEAAALLAAADAEEAALHALME